VAARREPLACRDQPRHSGCWTRSRTGMLRSWCSDTSQLVSGVFEKAVHWTATVLEGRCRAISGLDRTLCARFRHHANSRSARNPASSEVKVSKCPATSEHSVSARTRSTTTNPCDSIASGYCSAVRSTCTGTVQPPKHSSDSWASETAGIAST
jgi:hypothetical protein